MNRIGRKRKVIVVFLLVLILPIVGQAVTYTPPTSGSGATNSSTTAGQANVTFMTIQGNTAGKGGTVYAVDTDTKEVIWSHDSYYKKYFDVDLLDDSTILFTAMVHDWPWNGGDGYPWYAIIYDWRNDTLVDRFPVPSDTRCRLPQRREVRHRRQNAPQQATSSVY